MSVVTPEQWYRIYWTLMGIAGFVAMYFVVKWAIIAALVEIADG